MAQIKIKVGLAKAVFDSNTDDEISKLKDRTICEHIFKEISKLYYEGYFEVKSRYVDNSENDELGVEYGLTFLILNDKECDNLQKKLKNKR